MMDKWTERVYIAWQYFGVVFISWFFFAIKYENDYHIKLNIILLLSILFIKIFLGFGIARKPKINIKKQ